ncbi:recombinase RecT [Methylorubrum rhodesianum]|uniref:recombinase RecT n=1 Tax=Methylorubrum rhodesianum TaxID=29427 RepID=UPI003D2C4EBA
MNAVATLRQPTKLEQVLGEVLPADRRDDFYRVLPKHISPERFERAVANVLMNTPEMLAADPRLIFREISKVVGLGLMLDPQLGEAYLILGWNAKTRQKEPQVRIGYKGLIKLAKQSGEILNIYAREVHEKDEIECLQGDENRLIHKPRLFTDRGPVVGYYAVAKLRNGEIDFEPMSVQQIHEIRDRSDGWKAFRDGKIKQTPWSTDEGEMSKKTVLRRLQKRLTQSPDLVAAVAIEDNAEFSAFDRGKADALPPPPPRRQVAQRPAQQVIEHQPEPQPVEDARFDAPPADEHDDDGVVSKDSLLTELDERMSFAKTADDVEEAYTDFDAEALLSDYEGGVEAARKLKAQHLDRVPAAQQEKSAAPTADDDFPGNDAIEAAQAETTVTSGSFVKGPFEIPERFKGGGHYQIFIRRAADEAKPGDEPKLQAVWNDTKAQREELYAQGQLERVDVTMLRDAIAGALARISPPEPEADEPTDLPPLPPRRQQQPADPIAAYTAQMEAAFAAATTKEAVDKFWFATVDTRDESGATEDQQTKWRLARSKAKNALPSQEG